jgi:hypothetical protein
VESYGTSHPGSSSFTLTLPSNEETADGLESEFDGLMKKMIKITTAIYRDVLKIVVCR